MHLFILFYVPVLVVSVQNAAIFWSYVHALLWCSSCFSGAGRQMVRPSLKTQSCSPETCDQKTARWIFLLTFKRLKVAASKLRSTAPMRCQTKLYILTHESFLIDTTCTWWNWCGGKYHDMASRNNLLLTAALLWINLIQSGGSRMFVHLTFHYKVIANCTM